MSKEIKCDCGKEFSDKRYMARHKVTTCILNPNRIQYDCDHCAKSFSRKDILERHLLICPYSKVPRVTTEPEQTSSQAEIVSNQGNTSSSSHNQTHSLSHNTINNTHSNNTLNSNNHTVINNYNIAYTADFTSDNIIETLIRYLNADYIDRGEDGFADFLMTRFFTDPNNINNLAIACTNYNQRKFVYSMKDDNNQAGSIQEDYRLTRLEELYLSQYNELIKQIITDYSSELKSCKGKTTRETKENIKNLMDSILNRKKLASLMASKVRSKKEQDNEPLIKKDLLRERWKEALKDFTLLGVYNPKGKKKEENIDDTLSRSSFSCSSSTSDQQNKVSSLSNTDEQDEKEEEDPDKLYKQCLQESIEEQKQFEMRSKEKKEKREEQDRKCRESLQLKEQLRRAKEIAKQQAFQQQIEKKKNQLDTKIVRKSKSTPVEQLEPIAE